MVWSKESRCDKNGREEWRFDIEERLEEEEEEEVWFGPASWEKGLRTGKALLILFRLRMS